jgi:peptide/nickel transport system substrate-binding protein
MDVLKGLALGLVALAATACGQRPTPEARPLEILVPTEVSTLDPRFSTKSLDVKVTRLLHAGLFGLDPVTLVPVPLLAERFERPGERELVVTLKPNLRFHSGKPLTAEDVCATLNAVRDPALGSPHRAVVRAIGSCEVQSGDRVRIRLEEARATLLSDLEIPILRADQARLLPQPTGDLDGLGPYRLVRFATAETLLEPADTGALPRPKHAVCVRTVRDENARALRLLAGRSDIAPNAISPTLLPALDGRSGLSVHSRPGANVTYLLFQNDRAPLDRVEVRRAIARAIDRRTIVQTLLSGRGQLASSMLPPGHWARAERLEPEPFEPARSRSVLASERPLTLLTSTDRARVTIARAIAQMLGDAGLSVRVVTLDLGVLLQRLDSGDFELASLQMPEITEPNVLAWFFHPRGVPGEGGIGKNRARYRNQEVGTLFDRASAENDREERRRLYVTIAERMANELPAVPLWHEDQVAVVSERARGFELSAEGRWLDVIGE